jgi:hypothetical protein
MSLSTDFLLFSVVLVLIAIQTALPVTEGGGNFLLAGTGIAVLGLLISIITSVMEADSGPTRKENSER